MANCVIYYNATILSKMLEYRDRKEVSSDSLKSISPVAWRYINFYSHYEFNKYPDSINLEVIVQKLALLNVIPDE